MQNDTSFLSFFFEDRRLIDKMIPSVPLKPSIYFNQKTGKKVRLISVVPNFLPKYEAWRSKILYESYSEYELTERGVYHYAVTTELDGPTGLMVPLCSCSYELLYFYYNFTKI